MRIELCVFNIYLKLMFIRIFYIMFLYSIIFSFMCFYIFCRYMKNKYFLMKKESFDFYFFGRVILEKIEFCVF